MKYFISQPMRGKKVKQIKAERKELIEVLKIFDPDAVILDNVFPEVKKEGRTPLMYLAKSLEIMAQADAALFMPGFGEARGCRIEAVVADCYSILSLPAPLFSGNKTFFEEHTELYNTPESRRAFLHVLREGVASA